MLRIAITGPESSGKTTIANQLAHELNGCLINEYSRTYLENKLKENPSYIYDLQDVLSIGKRQYQLNLGEDCEKNVLICDTEMTVIKVWCEDKFKVLPPEVQKLFVAQEFDMVFLCRPDIPWQADPLREDGNRREYLYKLYELSLKESALPYIVLEGNRNFRLQSAKKFVAQLI